MGHETGIDLDALIGVAEWMAERLGKELPGRPTRPATSSRCRASAPSATAFGTSARRLSGRRSSRGLGAVPRLASQPVSPDVGLGWRTGDVWRESFGGPSGALRSGLFGAEALLAGQVGPPSRRAPGAGASSPRSVANRGVGIRPRANEPSILATVQPITQPHRRQRGERPSSPAAPSLRAGFRSGIRAWPHLPYLPRNFGSRFSKKALRASFESSVDWTIAMWDETRSRLVRRSLRTDW
jgi:hypothetical protein